MRGGYSTGACAAAAAKAAALAAAGHGPAGAVEIPFPDGTRAGLPVAWARALAEGGEAAVVKDAGDDPDITQGALVVVRVLRAEGWRFKAGEGVGTVTRPGLQIPPGEPAINPVPRAMIRAALEECGWTGASIRVAIPGGAGLAQRTFNPRLGVAGGLSILGTAGTVRPFSLEAIRATVSCALDVARATGSDRACLVPGHLGERAARAAFPLAPEQVVEVSNEWGHALEAAGVKGFRALLLVGHPGKLAKLAEGHFDTHSSRSPSALGPVCALLEAMDLPVASAPTVEGLFQALPPGVSGRVAERLAAQVARAAGARAGLPCAVFLSTMDAGLYGGSAEGTPWA
jgi:cobalt-precorrin-5B (C1)-methyltransferase